MTEIWKDIDGYDGLYQVSNLGHVKSFRRGRERILKASPNSNGYPKVSLGKCNNTFVHRLVATAFVPNPDDKPEVNHINGDKSDNRAVNLEWCTPSENTQHAFTTGLNSVPQGEDSPNAKFTNTQVRYIRDNPDGLTVTKLAWQFGTNSSTISEIQRGKRYYNVGGAIRDKIDTRIPDEVREQIRAEYVFGSREFGSTALAKKYGIAQHTIWRIVHGR